jgi:hypothetical protein
VLRNGAALPRLSGRDSELVGSQVAALLAEQKTAERGDELLRFGRPYRERGRRSRRLAVAEGEARARALSSALRRWAAATADDVLPAIDAALEHPFVTRT